MMDKHPFQGPDHGSCTYRHGGQNGEPCGYLPANEIHDLRPQVMTGPAEAVDRVRSVPAGRRRRSMPWNELPWASKALAVVGGAAVTAVLLCLVATVCRLILSAGGWLG